MINFQIDANHRNPENKQSLSEYKCIINKKLAKLDYFWIYEE